MTVSEVDTMEPEVDQMAQPNAEVRSMIDYAMANEFNKANDVFGDMMTIKLNDLLDQEQVRLADTIYNGAEDDENDEDIEDEDDEQLEFDLETDGEPESEESDEVEEPEEDVEAEQN
jgi:hypothetical protein